MVVKNEDLEMNIEKENLHFKLEITKVLIHLFD